MTGIEMAQAISATLLDKYGDSLDPSLIYKQLAHESGGFTSELATKHHNYSGLTQNTPNDLKQPDGANYYREFASDEDYTNAMADYLHLYKEDGLFNATNTKEYAEALKRGGYYTDTVENYVSGMERFTADAPLAIEKSAGINLAYDDMNTLSSSVRPSEPIVPQEVEEVPEQSWSLFADKFQNAIYDTILVGGARTAMVTNGYANTPEFKLTQEDIDGVFKELDNNYTATLFVCQNANSYEQLKALTNMKKGDLERQRRIDASSMGWTTAGSILGNILDPLNYVTLIAPPAAVTKHSLWVNRLLNSFNKFAYGAGTNAIDRLFAEKAAGFEQNYQMAMLTGGAAGVALPIASELIRRGYTKAGVKILSAATEGVEDAEKLAKSLGEGTNGTAKAAEKGARQFANVEDFVNGLKKYHDPEFAKSFNNPEILNKVRPENNVYVVSFEEAKKLAEERGIMLNEKAKGIFDDATGLSILIKDKLKDEKDVLKTLLHEKGAHGLKYVLSENEYKKVIADAIFRMRENPTPPWIRAMQRAGKDADPEEVLGYLAEEMKVSNPFMRKLKKYVDKSLGGERLTDDEFYDILKRSAEVKRETAQGYRVLSEDGDCIMNGFHYSKENILNPDALNYVGDLSWGKKLSRWLSRSKLFATPYNVAATSVSPKMREFGERFMHNPYMDKLLKYVPVESYKEYFYRKALTRLQDFYNIRDKYCVEYGKLMGRFDADLKQEFNRMVIEEYNAKYGHITKRVTQEAGQKVNPIVSEAVESMRALRNQMIEDMKNTQRIMGEGRQLLPDDWECFDDEFWRFIDNDKRANFLNSFEKEADAVEFLTNYAKLAIKRDVIRKQLEKEAKEAWEKELKELEKQGRKTPTKAPDAPAKMPPPVTEADIDARVQKEAEEWAKGVTDNGANIRHMSNTNMSDDIGQLEFMQHRCPMDTSMVIKDQFGADWSYDMCLRSYDIDNTLPQMLNRFAGECALSNIFSGKNVHYENTLGITERFKDNVDNLRQTIEAELQTAVDRNIISKSTMQDELDVFDYVMGRIRGVATKADPKNRWDLTAALLKDLSYAQNGANMGINQIGEVSGVIAYEGFAPIMDFIPSLGKTVSDAKLGKDVNQLVDDAVYEMYGDDMMKYIWSNANSTSSIGWRRVGSMDSRGFDKAMDKLQGGINTAASFTSTISGLQKLTASMTYATRKHCLLDVNKMLNSVKEVGEATYTVNLSQFGFTRPFSTSKLKAAGFTSLDQFINTYKPYMKAMGKDKMQVLDIQRLKAEKPFDFWKLYTFVDNQSRRCITQESIGNANMLKESSNFWRVFFQFKDFTMRATHSQTLRVMSNRELDDYLSTIFGIATAIPCYTGLTYARAWAKYHDDDAKRQEYLDKYLSPTAVLYAGFMRSPILGSPLSTGNDLLEMAGMSPAPTIRTTVNRYENPNFIDNPAGAIGSAVAQLPAVNTGYKMAVKAPYDIGKAIFTDDAYTRQDLQNFLSILPSQNHILSIYLREELADWLDLPEKQRRKRRR